MAITADGQWNQRDKLWLSPDSEMNGKLVNNSPLHNPKRLVLKLAITDDFFFLFTYTFYPEVSAGGPELIPLLNWWDGSLSALRWLPGCGEALQILQSEGRLESSVMNLELGSQATPGTFCLRGWLEE